LPGARREGVGSFNSEEEIQASGTEILALPRGFKGVYFLLLYIFLNEFFIIWKCREEKGGCGSWLGF
jgi:hypothetical protein